MAEVGRGYLDDSSCLLRQEGCVSPDVLRIRGRSVGWHRLMAAPVCHAYTRGYGEQASAGQPFPLRLKTRQLYAHGRCALDLVLSSWTRDFVQLLSVLPQDLPSY